uniref:Major facilitator superfamily (MFS) profile domain-containing protein n=1 Tax=Labrus bergylta TaxID=56723 RepID=A0A3Q3G6P3_9LABR
MARFFKSFIAGSYLTLSGESVMSHQDASQWIQKCGGVPSPALMSLCPWVRIRVKTATVVVHIDMKNMLILSFLPFSGPVSSAMVNRFGSRPVVIVGGLMCGVSMVTASLGTSIIYLYFCIGVIGGCGLSLNLNASLIIISKYFLTKRPLANGLAMAGSPVFLCILAPFNQYLLDNFGWRGSLLILGALMLHCCAAGALMRPVTPPHTAKTFLDLSFFKDRGFVIYLIGNIMFIFGAYAPIVFLTAFAISKGVEEYSAAYLLSIMGFVDMFVRPGTGLIANSKWIRPRIQYFFSFAMVFNGTCHLLCPLIENYAFLVVYAVFFGIGFGMVFALIFECLMDLMGSQRFPRAVGLVTIIEWLLVDIYGDYRYLFFMCGSVILTGGIFLFVMNIYNYHMLEKEKQNQVRASEVEMKQTPEAAMGHTEPEAQEKNGVLRDTRSERAETPN